MKTLEEYTKVRLMHAEQNMSIREIARRTGINRRTVRKMILLGAPKPFKVEGRSRPRLDAVSPIIDRILDEDRSAPKKQRHTALRIWERLKSEHGYEGGFTQVRDYVRKALATRREAFVPLAFDPGTAQVDWGEALALNRGQRLKVYLFVMTLPWSNVRFVAAFPRATQEFFFEGHLRAFAFLGGVPRRIIYDNLASAVQKVLRGRARVVNKVFESFAEHYLFEPAFCNVAKGNEKGHVENGVGWAQRHLMTPLPELCDWSSMNERLAQQCKQAMAVRAPKGEGESIAERLCIESESLRQIPEVLPPFMRPRPAKVRSTSLVRFDTNDYSVPTSLAHHDVVVEADVAGIRIFHEDRLVAAHERLHGSGQAVYDPVHYLGLVERKPRTLEDGAPMRELLACLPECFSILRRRMEMNDRPSKGIRSYIRTLRLLECHSLDELTRAVERANDLGVSDDEAVKNLLLCPPESVPTPLDLEGRGHLQVKIPLPDPRAYSPLAIGGV